MCVEICILFAVTQFVLSVASLKFAYDIDEFFIRLRFYIFRMLVFSFYNCCQVCAYNLEVLVSSVNLYL